MIECMRLIIGEVGTRERERERLKIGRSERSRTIWAAVKGPQCWGRKWGLQLSFEVVRGQTTSAIKQEQIPCSHAEDPAVKELGKA